MKRILLIGEINRTIENLHKYLIPEFHVELCSLEEETVQAMLKSANPNLVIICLAGMDETQRAIFDMLRDALIRIPVLTIGKKQESEQYQEYYKTEQFDAMFKPITNTELLAACREKLDDGKRTETNRVYNTWENSEKKHVMIVDDSPLVLRSIKSMLASKYQISVANSGSQALQLIPIKKPDLILLDYEMPNLDGKQTFEKLKEDEFGKHIPVVFLTGVSDKEHIYAVLALEPAGYILKPPSMDKLLNAIENALK